MAVLASQEISSSSFTSTSSGSVVAPDAATLRERLAWLERLIP